jgi:hypothetical protein
MKRLLFLALMMGFFSCEADLLNMEALGDNADIVGTWVEDEYQGDTLYLDRSRAFDKNKYGFTIHEDGTFTEHKNAGWCGTPPITYDSFEGSWEAVSDSLLDITVGYWGGVMTYQMRIVYLDTEKLAIRYLYTENRTDSRKDY